MTGISANNKTYDATPAATLNAANATLSGILSGDTVTLITSGMTGTFSGKDVANNIPVSVSGLILGGAQAGDYTLGPVTTTGNITPASLTVTGVTADDKVYDSTTAATLDTSKAVPVGLFQGDSVVVTGGTGAFASKDVGSGILVTVPGMILGGPQASDYTVVQPTATATITPAPISVASIAVSNKVYDGTTTATPIPSGGILSGLFSGDAVTLDMSGVSAVFTSNRTRAATFPVTVSGFGLSGPQANDYFLTQTTASSTATILPATLTVTGITANNKVYDGTTQAQLNTAGATVTGVLSGDMVTLAASGATGTFANKNIAANINVAVSGLTLSGLQAGDYTVRPPLLKASITQATLTVTGITANNKVYDGTTAATLNTNAAALSGLAGGDAITLNSSAATGTFASPNVGNNIMVAVSGLTINGTQAFDYKLTQPTTTANITAGFSGFAVNVLGGISLTAGNAFLFTVQAVDSSGNPVQPFTSGPYYHHPLRYPGRSVGKSSIDPARSTATASGFFLGTLSTAGTYTLAATAGSVTGASANISVIPSSATGFVVTADSSAITGSSVNVAIKALDAFGNLATGYNGLVHFSSSDPKAGLPADANLVGGVGNFNVTLNSAGNQTITATDSTSTNPTITGTSNPLAVAGLRVIAFTSTPDGFTATFNKAIVPGDLALYGTNLAQAAAITMTGNNGVGAIHGSLLIDPSNLKVTFKATSDYLSLRNGALNGNGDPVLPDATYTVKLLSGTPPFPPTQGGNGGVGFMDAAGRRPGRSQ